MKYRFIFFGMAFGFFLSRAGATTFDFYAKLFLFEDLQLLWVILSAVAVGIIGLRLLKYFNVKAIVSGVELSFDSKTMEKGLIVGSLLFGLGWGLTGTCPGSAAAMLGEGKIMALPTGFGILFGTYLYARQKHIPEK
ncbi:MAG: YeeE/YedE family protein [Gammaproteobacteria bacterium]|nr:YeeE/YedE family protein [Gammaproteobacteria bacterium]MDH5776632.1 YeeE/YedE family protein [Gammaproteobacteria bacterium]